MILSLIAAIGKNNELGKNNQLLWNLPADMRHFRETTSGHTVIMGRKTFESIGRPLPNRINIIITRDASYTAEGVMVAHSLEEALRFASLEHGKGFEENQDDVEVFVIGGAEIYNQAITKANTLYITKVDKEFDADAFFPVIDDTWQQASIEPHDPDEKNEYPYAFITYTKKSAL
jgi:dihydrofolate reductase